ncbi:multidrug efflux MFS transporter [Paenibacillus cremeus]|uniref:Multidrug efflux MFS transporter n=2 Tax=Paenibacillus cremeus TaxID=2163881 RepID=A0A559KIS8_9BACL|nr:multidrug efflux MFS transporter [Paenibacillus cremeus]
MSLVQGIMMLAFTSTSSFMAFYIEQLGVHEMHKVDIWSGVIQSATPLVAALASPIWGSLSDRTGRKMMVLRSTVAIAIFNALAGLSQNTWQLLGLRALQGAFSGFSAAAIALVSTVIPEEKLGFSLGWIQSAGMVGSLLGPLVGGLLADSVGSYRAVFYLTSTFAILAFVVTLIFVKEDFQPAGGNKGGGKRKLSLVGQFRAVKELKSVQTMFLVLFITQFSVMSVQPVLPVFMKELMNGTTGLLGTIAGFAFSVTGLADLIASPFLGKRSDQLGYRRVLTICMTGAGLFYLPQALAPNIWVFVASRFGLGLFVGGILPTANALVGRLTPKHQRGQVFGLTSSATFLGSFAGPLLGGLGSAALGIRWMLGFTCLLYLLNMVWVRLKVKDPESMEAST